MALSEWSLIRTEALLKGMMDQTVQGVLILMCQFFSVSV